MDTVLLILGVLGAGAVVISVYVFMVSARNYVTDSDDQSGQQAATSPENAFIERSNRDRRLKPQFDFPMTVNGMLIPFDRRSLLERRGNAA